MLAKLDGTITMQMRLPRTDAFVPRPDLLIREVARDEIEAAFAGSMLEPGTLVELDSIAPVRWRCFAAFENNRPVHHTFVAYREAGPELFRVLTAPSHRRRGIFVVVVSAIARTLSMELETSLTSKLGVRNSTSLAAHRAAGFVVVDRRYDPVLLGWNLRLVASKAWRAIRRRTA